MRKLLNLYHNAFSGLPGPIWVLSLAGLINRAGTMVLPFLSLYLTADRGYTLNQVGAILLSFGLGSVAGSFFGGKLCNTWGYFPVLTGSLLTSGLGFIILGSVRTYMGHIIGFFVLSALGDAFRPAIMTAVSQHSGDKTGQSMALLRLAINLGMALGPSIGGILAQSHFIYLFWADGITCILAALFLFTCRQHLNLRHHISKSPKGLSHNSSSPLRDWPFVFFLLFILGMSFSFFQLFGVYPLYLKNILHFEKQAIGYIIGFNATMIVILEMVLIHKTRNFNMMNVFALGVFLMGLGFGLMPLCSIVSESKFSSTILILVLTLIWTIGEMLSLPLASTLVARRSNRGHTGSYMAWYTASFSMAMLVWPPAGLYITQHWGRDMVWWIALSLTLTLPLGLLKLKPYFCEKEPVHVQKC